MRAPDVRLGSSIRYRDLVWTVWSHGPKPGEFWIVRYLADITAVTEAVHAKHLQSLNIRTPKENR